MVKNNFEKREIILIWGIEIEKRKNDSFDAGSRTEADSGKFT